MLRTKSSLDGDKISTYTIKNTTYKMPTLQFLDNIPKVLTEQALNELYDLFKFVHDLFTERGIEYFTICGSLLGAIRHQSFIPWDDDIDIAVVGTPENRTKIANLWMDLMKNGYLLVKTFPVWSIQKPFPLIHLDIFFIDNYNNTPYYNDSLFRYSYPYINNIPTYAVSRYLWRNDSYDSTLKPVLRKFCDFEVYIPQDFKEALEKSYGPHCLTSVNYGKDQEMHCYRIFKPCLYLVETLMYYTIGIERTYKLWKYLGKIE